MHENVSKVSEESERNLFDSAFSKLIIIVRFKIRNSLTHRKSFSLYSAREQWAEMKE